MLLTCHRVVEASRTSRHLAYYSMCNAKREIRKKGNNYRIFWPHVQICEFVAAYDCLLFCVCTHRSRSRAHCMVDLGSVTSCTARAMGRHVPVSCSQALVHHATRVSTVEKCEPVESAKGPYRRRHCFLTNALLLPMSTRSHSPISIALLSLAVRCPRRARASCDGCVGAAAWLLSGACVFVCAVAALMTETVICLHIY
jgi:hypothetical protein